MTKADIHADIATELMGGLKPGRENDDERTIMTHLGMSALDAAVASLVYDLALDQGAGTTMKIF
jgi:ornithine cyclodeaminase/alanine dehydrogenase-like protein (mu-crystallin family)